jgi:hypothetical protein
MKQQLQNTCVKSESHEMGAEIIALYVKAGFENIYNLKGEYPRFYYGPIDMPHIQHSPDVIGIRCRSITLDQLREIVNGKDWSKASESELIEEAKRRYPVGTIVRLIPENVGGKFKNEVKWTDFHYYSNKSLFVDGNLLLFYGGEWAEIISKPNLEPKEASPEMQQAFVEANPNMKFTEEFKAGDEVEYEYARGRWKSAKYTGGKTSGGEFIIEIDKILWPVKQIRKPQDKVREKAKELFLKYQAMPNPNESMPPEVFNIDMLIEAIKWGQQNPEVK